MVSLESGAAGGACQTAGRALPPDRTVLGGWVDDGGSERGGATGAGAAARAAFLGGDSALHCDHGAWGGDGPQRHGDCRSGWARGAAGVRARHRGHIVRLLRVYPAHLVLQPRGVRLRPLGGHARPEGRLLLRLGASGYLPVLHGRLNRRGRPLRAGIPGLDGPPRGRLGGDSAGRGGAHLGARPRGRPRGDARSSAWRGSR